MKRDRYSFKGTLTGLMLLLFSVLCMGMFTFLYYSHLQEAHRLDPAFNIQLLSHHGELPSHFIEELLALSVDHPPNIHEFDSEEAEKKLESHPVICKAKVSKALPDSCNVQYLLNHPVARLADWENGAIDSQGRLIPLVPFFSSVGLPQIILGDEKEIAWGEKLKIRRVRVALEILESLPLHDLQTLDVSRVDFPSFGKREIIVTLKDTVLRLNPDDWKEGWKNFLKMQNLTSKDIKFLEERSGGKGLGEKPFRVIDLRIPQIALLRYFCPQNDPQLPLLSIAQIME